MRRRDFISLLGGAAATLPLAARAQQADRVRRIGVLMNAVEDDRETKVRFEAFLQGLRQLGWIEGRNVRIDARWGTADIERQRKDPLELSPLAPDVTLGTTRSSTTALQQATRPIPIVFAMVVEPV